MTFADVLLAEALSSYLEWIPNILKDKPQISALYEKVLNVKEINIYLNSSQRYPMPGKNYVIDVARVLQRALPDHMSNPNRFISTN